MHRRSKLALIAGAGALALLAGLPLTAAAPGVTAYLGSYTWQMEDADFGGLSGLEIAGDGTNFSAISDRGSLITRALTRDAAGVVNGVAEARLTTLQGLSGAALTREEADPEGLALAPDGRIFISFEGLHRIWAYAATEVAAEPLPEHPDFAQLQSNSGLEALAIDDQGRLYAVPERSGRDDRPFHVYRLQDGAWTVPFHLPRDGRYLPAGADFGPDGQFYLLERDFRGPPGFFARVSRFDLTADSPGPREVLWQTRAPFQNNFEGIAVWQDTVGDIRFTLISDDNFTRPLTTEFADYRIGN